MTLSLIVELALSVLLTATIVYCAILERRLSMLRTGQDGLKQTFGEMNTAIVSAGAAIRALKESAASAADALDDRLSRARGMADELSLLTASGERIAERIVGQRSAQPLPESAKSARSAVLAGRLESLRPEALRNVR
ncbi:MAG: DUF6468 domain-containing protein [Rhizomicrobium sp.]|jgi:hypothetical protein